MGQSLGKLADICMTQQEILLALWPLVKCGGRLSYVTCSVLADENEKQMDTFLKQQRDARAIDNCQWARRLKPGQQILPGMNSMDGFYHAQVIKRDEA